MKLKLLPPKKPHTIKIETVFGCNLRCKFCGITAFPAKMEKQFISTEIVLHISKLIASQKWELRIEMGMRGEPTLHPDIVGIVQVLRNLNPKISITLYSNGKTLSEKLAISLLNAGLNILAVDCYGDTYQKYKEKFAMLDPYTYGIDKDATIWKKMNPNKFKLILLPDIDTPEGQSRVRKLNNQGGACSSLPEPLQRNCYMPCKELVILHNGAIPICCKDWLEKSKIRNILNVKDLYAFWNSNEILNKYRTRLQNKDRSLLPCNVCDYSGGAPMWYHEKKGS